MSVVEEKYTWGGLEMPDVGFCGIDCDCVDGGARVLGITTRLKTQ